MSFRKITVKSGDEEFTLEVTEEEYQKYYRPWWQQKKHEQRNREAMEQNGYTEESYEAWRDNASEGAGIPDMHTLAEQLKAVAGEQERWGRMMAQTYRALCGRLPQE